MYALAYHPRYTTPHTIPPPTTRITSHHTPHIVNSVITFYWRGMVMHDIDQDAYDYLAVTVPIVTIMAPVGATLASHFHRHVLAFFVYALDTAALIGLVSGLLIGQ